MQTATIVFTAETVEHIITLILRLMSGKSAMEKRQTAILCIVAIFLILAIPTDLIPKE